jgi:SET domain-containing protein
MDEKSDRCIMYKEHLELRQCKTGRGVFTNVQIPAGEAILEVTGPVMLDRDVPNMDDPFLLQVGPNTFIGASGDVDDCINHHCDPNCRMHVVGNRAFLYSLYVIPAGAELTFDYSTTSTDTLDSWKMECKCGAHKCRVLISGHHYLDSALKTHYESQGILPLYISMPNLIQKR